MDRIIFFLLLFLVVLDSVNEEDVRLLLSLRH